MANSLYLHVPFCEHICFYCDFKRSVYQKGVVDAWLNRIHEDLSTKVMSKSLKTIYIGGGTPTCLSYNQLETLLSYLLPLSQNMEEYTIESNLESIDEDKLRLLKQYGVNRISLGVQSYNDELLVSMNRNHLSSEINQTIEMISNYISNITIDLIYGFQNQSMDIWKDSLIQAVSNIKIKHISIYSLTIEDDSVFGKRGVKLIDNEIEAAMYEQAILILKESGFKQYEIANFSRTGFESKHNQCYWRYDDFYGVGLGASGKENAIRYEINGSISEYIEHKEAIVEEALSNKDELFEYIMMNLRMRKGIDLDSFQQRWNFDFLNYFKEVNERLFDKKQIQMSEKSLATTESGMFYLHDILVEYMEYLEKKPFII